MPCKFQVFEFQITLDQVDSYAGDFWGGRFSSLQAPLKTPLGKATDILVDENKIGHLH